MRNILGILVAISGAAWAQNASLEGVVTDPSSAVIVAASVTATNGDTGVRYIARTNSAGEYAFPSLLPGRYQVAAEAPGFRTATRKDLVLEVEQSARLDFSMEIGDARQSVTVEGG